jgi:formylglycine-generating enzyme required for sulfatase activity
LLTATLPGCFVSKSEVAGWAELATEKPGVQEDGHDHLGGSGAPDGAADGAADDTAADAEGDDGGDGGGVDPAAGRPSSFVEPSSGMEFVLIGASTFDMGCTPGQSSCQDHELPVRPTTLTRDYYVGRTEVTQEQFTAVMGFNPSSDAACGPSCPVEGVTWDEAAAFANAVSTAAGLHRCYTCTGIGSARACIAPADPYACVGFRLPTEAEWEGAARCDEDLLYAGSDVIDEVAWTASSPGDTTFAVGGLAPNGCGLYDMSGNVFEWVHDLYPFAAYSDGGVVDPVGPVSGSARVVRGGSWYGTAETARVAFRSAFAPGSRSLDTGFRLVRTAP